MGFRDFEKLRERVELVENGLWIHNFIVVVLQVITYRYDDFASFRWWEPVSRLTSGGRCVELHVVREGLRLRVAEGDELAQPSEVQLVGDSVDCVALGGEYSPREALGLHSGDVFLKDEGQSQTHPDTILRRSKGHHIARFCIPTLIGVNRIRRHAVALRRETERSAKRAFLLQHGSALGHRFPSRFP